MIYKKQGYAFQDLRQWKLGPRGHINGQRTLRWTIKNRSISQHSYVALEGSYNPDPMKWDVIQLRGWSLSEHRQRDPIKKNKNKKADYRNGLISKDSLRPLLTVSSVEIQNASLLRSSVLISPPLGGNLTCSMPIYFNEEIQCFASAKWSATGFLKSLVRISLLCSDILVFSIREQHRAETKHGMLKASDRIGSHKKLFPFWEFALPPDKWHCHGEQNGPQLC